MSRIKELISTWCPNCGHDENFNSFEQVCYTCGWKEMENLWKMGDNVVWVNLCPHTMTIAGIDIEQTGLARVTMTRKVAGHVTIDGHIVPVNYVTVGEVTGLPDQQDGVAYIVSRQVAEALPGRRDLFIPDETQRNDKDQIIGSKSLAQVPQMTKEVKS